jgi:CDP-6-deoxy-D-xylo-4-hexulose-3-dehydrase
MPCHLFGQPCDMRPLLQLADAHGLRVIEDSCDTMFASCGGQSVGSFGDVSCFSTRASHIVSTGIGGFACTADPDVARVVTSLFHDGRADPLGAAAAVDVVVRFHFERFGFNCRATEMEAALGVAQFEERAARLAAHRRNAGILSDLLADHADDLQLPWWPPHVEHSFSAYPLLLRKRAARKDDLMTCLAARGVESRAMFPLVSQPIVQAIFGDIGATLPVARGLDTHGFYVGCHEDLDEQALRLTGSAILAYLESPGR